MSGARRSLGIRSFERPSAGFVMLVLVLLAAVAFFVWGAQTPRLEEIWRLDIEFGLGERPALSTDERRMLQSALIDYPGLAEFLIEDKHAGLLVANDDGLVEGDYAYLIRPAAEWPGTLAIGYAGNSEKGAMRVSARASGEQANGETRRDAPFIWRLPDSGPFPQLVEIRLSPVPRKKKGKRRHYPVCIDLREKP